MKEKMLEHEKAKKAGDTEKVKQLEKWGQAQQDKLHKQGFGTASIKSLLEHIKRDIPKVAKEAGVDIIVSKWELVYQAKDAEFVDVTELIIRGYKPPERALKSIRSLKDWKPISEKKLEGHKH
jgi:Skp family chaperone for outer membrane proteins